MNEQRPLTEFAGYGKTPRLFRDCVITEKVDGSNGCVAVVPLDGMPALPACTVAHVGKFALLAGSRTKWVTPGKNSDNYGFAQWVKDNADELVKLGPGRHFGEWYGRGINRAYGLTDRRFALFNVSRWEDGALSPKTFQRGVEQPRVPLSPRPACCELVPVLYRGPFDTDSIRQTLSLLQTAGSLSAPGFMQPEGIVVFHTAANQVFKVLIENDEAPKGSEGQ